MTGEIIGMKKRYRILAKNELVDNNTFVTGLNNNDVIIGPSGAGKTRGYVMPNILRMNESMVIADTKGQLIEELGETLKANGYVVKCLDFTGYRESCGYNPFDYIRYYKETDSYRMKDLKTIATALVPLTSKREPYWELAARQVVEYLGAYTLECLPKEEQNLVSVCKLFNIMGTRPYRQLFRELELLYPESYAVSVYKMLESCSAADKTYESIRMILAQKLYMYEDEEVKVMLTKDDRIDFKTMGREKTALFLTISDTDRSMDQLISLFYAQAFHELCDSADHDFMYGRLKIPVRFYLDDFAANVFIPDFDKLIAVIRSREISVSIILQSLSQLEQMYGAAGAKTILNNCDNCLYLGGQDVQTAEFISRKANKTASSILNMPLQEAWLFQRGREPRQVEKYA